MYFIDSDNVLQSAHYIGKSSVNNPNCIPRRSTAIPGRRRAPRNSARRCSCWVGLFPTTVSLSRRLKHTFARAIYTIMPSSQYYRYPPPPTPLARYISTLFFFFFFVVLTVHPFPSPRRKARFFLRSDPNQLGLEPGLAPFQFGRQKRGSRTPEPVHYVAAAGGLAFLTGVRERSSPVYVELVTPVVEDGHVGLRGRTARCAAVQRKFYTRRVEKRIELKF